MTTTNANGIVFLEETDPISPFHTLMNTLQQGTSDALDAKAATVLDPLTAAWNTYIPSWTASTTNPIIGAGGGIGGRYRKIGRTVEFTLWMYLGTSGASGGSGIWRWSIPAAPDNGSLYVVSGHLINGSGYQTLAGSIANNSYVELVTTGGGNVLSSGFVLAGGSRIILSGTYQSAS